MKFRFLYLSVLIFALVSCNNNDEKRNLENARDLKKKELVFANIQKAWNFNARPDNPTAGSLAVSWAEWRIFLGELSQKPTSTIGAFRKKAKTLSLKAKDLNNHIPMVFNKPEIKARIAVLSTKINSLNLFVNVDAIPDAKVIALISEINIELASLQMQMDEIVRKSKIPKEEGESDMLKMLDTSRAIPDKPKRDPALNPKTHQRILKDAPNLKTNK
jgi:hypothetical protein